MNAKYPGPATEGYADNKMAWYTAKQAESIRVPKQFTSASLNNSN